MGCTSTTVPEGHSGYNLYQLTNPQFNATRTGAFNWDGNGQASASAAPHASRTN